jgi:hypothetical protein
MKQVNQAARSAIKYNVVDQAKSHFLGNFPDFLPIERAYTHIGIYLGWAIENQLYSDYFEDESEVQIYRFKRREISCAILSEIWDGYLGLDLFNEHGAAFTRHYYVSGSYLIDYKDCLAREYNSLYEVTDSWLNYEKMAVRISDRFQAWEKARK